MMILRRLWLRNVLLIQLICLIAVMSYMTGRAHAIEKKKDVRPPVTTPRPAPTTTATTSTSTTTTTVPPTRRKVQETPKVAPVSVSVPQGDWVAQCHAWAKLAGIDLPPAAITLIDRESDCNPTIRNPNSSAGGIPQALPWTKMGCGLGWTDEVAICQLKWMHGYVMGRYSSWEKALNHSYNRGWY